MPLGAAQRRGLGLEPRLPGCEGAGDGEPAGCRFAESWLSVLAGLQGVLGRAGHRAVRAWMASLR